jgi:hypothetical protein
MRHKQTIKPQPPKRPKPDIVLIKHNGETIIFDRSTGYVLFGF